MRQTPTTLTLSPTDLANFLACHHKSTQDHALAKGLRKPPKWSDPGAEALAQRGLEHEKAYVATLTDVVDLTDQPDRVARTLQAMQEGKGAIVQGALQDDKWFGFPDVLLRMDDGTYEVVDTKLAKETKGGAILQLAVYSDLLGKVQSHPPEHFHVVTPVAKHTYRLDDYTAYVRQARAQLLDAIATPQATYPLPVEHCAICRYWQECDQRRRDDDHLSFVAGLTRLQTRELESAGIATLAQLGAAPPKDATFARVHDQARLQLHARTTNAPTYELLDVVEGRGLTRLPEPSPGDLFLDLEGDPFARDEGREYLFGLARTDGTTRAWWAFTDAEERAAFEATVDEIMRLWAEHPGMHVFHYNHYEPTAFKKLMGRYATREVEIDRMLRAGVFVDLYGVVKTSLIAGIERYSLKELERFYGFTRDVKLEDARSNLRIMERALELRTPDLATPAVRAAVEGYNRDDCVSTWKLRDWLEGLRPSDMARPAPQQDAAPEDVDERARKVAEVSAALLEGVPADREARDEPQQARWLLAHLLDWHRREMKSEYWEKFRLEELDTEELHDERAGLAGLTQVARVFVPTGRKKAPVNRYTYPPQETDVREDAPLFLPGGEPFGDVVAADRSARTVDVKKRVAQADVHPTAVYAHKVFDNKEAPAALMRIAEDVVAHGIDAGVNHRVARQLLLARPPRLRTATFAPTDDETATAFAVRAATELDHCVLAVQGPPGAGKTYTGARIIRELVRRGLKVGVTAQSHKVVRKLLDDAGKACAENGVAIACTHKVSDLGELGPSLVTETDDNDAAFASLDDGSAQVLGGTIFMWPRERAAATIDVLIVDEAGQMSLANVLAASQAARSVVLLGDPQQLEQPQKGSHPDGAERSALQHVLGGRQTIPADRGVFLPETRRLAPAVCAFTSEVFYEGRLRSTANLERQRLVGVGPFDGAGLWFAPVEHDGNQNASPEEVDVVARLVDALLVPGAGWVDEHGATWPLTPADILVVAPYNTHVGVLDDRLPGLRVGTVDKFQGQEAPVVIYSMATSTPEDAPRGMEFLYSLNRLNVATSRARCACILVASPKLFEPDCKTPRQMPLANALCRYRELARVLDVGVLAKLDSAAADVRGRRGALARSME